MWTGILKLGIEYLDPKFTWKPENSIDTHVVVVVVVWKTLVEYSPLRKGVSSYWSASSALPKIGTSSHALSHLSRLSSQSHHLQGGARLYTFARSTISRFHNTTLLIVVVYHRA
jgi:hypothetical protein